MEDGGLERIDWQAPWLAPVRDLGEAISASPDWLDEVNQFAERRKLQSLDGRPLRFAGARALAADLGYEAFIAAHALIPTRQNRHDFFNALVWLSFPQVKAELGRMHATEISSAHTSHRGPLRDAATLFDENAVLVAFRDEYLIDLLRRHRWRELFVVERARLRAEVDIIAFGHALMDKLVDPFDAITAHAWAVKADDAYFGANLNDRIAWLDEHVALSLNTELRSPRDFMPLPVLGIPGWWAANEQALFYDDTSVFRPQRLEQVAR